MSEPLVSWETEFHASQQLALDIAKALGLPGLGRLCSLSIEFVSNDRALVRTTFYADPAQVAACVLPTLVAGAFRLVPTGECQPAGAVAGDSSKG